MTHTDNSLVPSPGSAKLENVLETKGRRLGGLFCIPKGVLTIHGQWAWHGVMSTLKYEYMVLCFGLELRAGLVGS